MLGSNRNRLPNRNRKAIRNTGLVRPRVEVLESRWAPGTLLDLFGLAALSATSEGMNRLVERNESGPPAFAVASNQQDHESISSQLLQWTSPDAPGPIQDQWYGELAQASRPDHDEMDGWGFSHRSSIRLMETPWQILDVAQDFDFSGLFLEDLQNFKQSREMFAIGNGDVHLPGTAFQPTSHMAGHAISPIHWPANGESGLASRPVDSQVEFGSSANPSANAEMLDENGVPMFLSEFFEAESLLPSVKQPKFEEHRLPLELRNRSDDLLAGQSLQPYSISHVKPLLEPTTGVVRSPAEYEPMRGVLFSYTSYTSVVTDLVKELTANPNTDDIAYVVVTSASQRNSATTAFSNAGADMSKVQFMIQPMNSVWMRDYGPHFITVDDALAIVDSHYYPTRFSDNFIPTLVGRQNFNVPTYDMGMYYSGGNFMPGPDNSAFVTALVNNDNPVADGFNPGLISELYYRFQGIETLHVLPQLPFSVDGTGHIDMWMYLMDEKTVIISEFLPGSNATAIEVTNNAVGYMESLGFKVYRTPAWNSGGVHYTYANAFRVNNRIFVPVYGTSFKPGGNSAYNARDAQAMAAWQLAAGPDIEIIPIQCIQIITASGAIHCIVKQVPRFVGDSPAVSIVSPSGGEFLTPSSQFKVEWSAIDTNNVNPTEIEIFVSYGDGKYEHLATTTDTGSYLWTLGSQVRRADSATIKIVARSAGGNKTEVISRPFSIIPGRVTTYDFSSGAGVNRFAYGFQTNSWADVDGNLSPVAGQLTSTNYARLATSNATGGASDINRYISPIPSSISAESTHLFTFQISTPTERMAQLDVLWEGYAAFATQVELYVWDHVANNWGDGAGLSGVNRYMDSWAGNIDGLLKGAIRSDFSRFIDDEGVLRVLVYADRPGAVGSPGQGVRTYHDYVSVRVTETGLGIPVRFA